MLWLKVLTTCQTTCDLVGCRSCIIICIVSLLCAKMSGRIFQKQSLSYIEQMHNLSTVLGALNQHYCCMVGAFQKLTARAWCKNILQKLELCIHIHTPRALSHSMIAGCLAPVIHKPSQLLLFVLYAYLLFESILWSQDRQYHHEPHHSILLQILLTFPWSIHITISLHQKFGSKLPRWWWQSSFIALCTSICLHAGKLCATQPTEPLDCEDLLWCNF